MKRLLLSLAVLILTLFGIFLPLMSFSSPSGSVGADPVTITDYRADVTVARDGSLDATETVTAEFPYGRHGIFRFWDLNDTSNRGVRFSPEDISITMDGSAVPFELSWEQGRRFRVARIGDAERYVTPGEHTYVLRYRVGGVLAAGSSPVHRGDTSSWGADASSRLLWRVVADGWQMTIKKTQSTIRLPDEPISFTCATNRGIDCQITAPDKTTRVVTTGELPPMTGVAVRADLPFPAPARSVLPWSIRFDPVLGRSLAGLVAALVISVLTFGAGLWLALRSREAPPLRPVMYSPPEDPVNPGKVLGPAQTFYVANEAMPRRALIATLFHLADVGAVRLERNGGDWTVHSQVTPEITATLDAADNSLLNSLGLGRSGATFRADGSVAAGQKLHGAQAALDGSVRGWGAASGTVVHSASEMMGRTLVAVAVIAAAALLVFHLVPASIWVLPLAAFAIGGAGLWSSGVGTRRTRLGREVWSRAAGFERLLSTRSNTERLDFSARKEIFTDYIPYAIAFDCADAWADKYRYATGQEPPEPLWFGGGFYAHSGIGGAGGFGGSAFDSFESSLSSSLSAYTASQSASSGSSGGGGFGGGFSGGGGGGGGGGSW
ncbi:hypothetical protein GOHSU_23_00280 [Gordonia hirsuta DSM 44140 = NBRC 16056]|uniref:DUF2207 domain-containing protein n=1 Tax=Gordonia hirsuta DSM 44140 = NBRC 16056 TaxID=1121927 RepID=L7LC77_9ACTN|nr:DUF2207 domain-containing protein [Gordonia hirsuta]GAC57682.1 hypothetical protein GOHSU_23_00280 [Gordonia hirsuta DSM 44140 = NBRC 16056]